MGQIGSPDILKTCDMRYTLCICMLFSLLSCSSDFTSVCDEDRIISIGKKLTGTEISHKNRASLENLVFIGDGLIRQLRILKSDDQVFNFKVVEGDIRSPYGDKEGDCVLVIASKNHHLNIRLKFNKQKDKYDILGWSDSY
jgi:hypothetical protein